MILNLHEMFILDWIHKCRQSSLGGFPVWSIVLGFVSHVLLVPFVLLPTFTLRIPLIVLFFSPPFNSTQVVNSSANLFIYCAIGARYLAVQPVALIQNVPCDLLLPPDFGHNAGSISFVGETELLASVLRHLLRC